MPIDLNILLNEARCLGCGSLSESEMIMVALLQRIAEASSSSGGGTPGGAANSVQFNDGGAFGGFGSYNSGTGLLTLTGIVGSVTGASSLNVLKAGDTMTGLLTIAQATANTSNLALTGYSLTGANAQSMISGAGTWNTTGNPVAIRYAITNTASGATAKFLEFLGGAAGATSLFSVTKAGNVSLGDSITSTTATTLNIIAAANQNLQLVTSGATGVSLSTVFIGFSANNKYFGWRNAALRLFDVDASTMLLSTDNTVANARDLELRNIITNNAAAAFTTNTTLTDFAAAALGTLTNAPTAGPPAKWIQIDDNGTNRFIPTWI